MVDTHDGLHAVEYRVVCTVDYTRWTIHGRVHGQAHDGLHMVEYMVDYKRWNIHGGLHTVDCKRWSKQCTT